ncbi:hypothetical protein OF83DRAFT_1034884, partial [Amylostereum chailletii]
LEWFKTCARAKQWNEEVHLLVEEMHQTLQYFDWKASWWTSRASMRSDTDPTLAKGLSAYAHKSSSMYTNLKAKFEDQWTWVHSQAANHFARYAL